MAEPQPRKYMTRGRAKAEQNPLSNPPLRSTRKPSEKRKALAESTTNENTATDPLPSKPPPPTRGRTAKKPATDTTKTSHVASSGLQTAPKRRTTRKNGTAASRKYNGKGTGVATSPRTKKVTFESSTMVLEDKENSPPASLADKPVEAETDTALSASLSALSVKPKRVPSSKLKQPSGSLMDAVPSLSPLKARPMRPVNSHKEENSMEDELSAESSPRLSTKPKRPIRPLGDKNAVLSMSVTKKPSDIPASVLFGSPAKRPLAAQLKHPKMHVEEERTSMASPEKKGLSSPARRPQARSGLSSSQTYPTPKLSTHITGCEPRSPFKLSNVTEENDPFVDATKEEFSEDELSSPSKTTGSVGRKLFVKSSGIGASSPKEQPSQKSGIFDTVSALDPKDFMTVEKSVDFGELGHESVFGHTALPVPSVSTTPPTPPFQGSSDFLLSKPTESSTGKPISDMHESEKEGVDIDGDIMMEDLDDSSPSAKLTPTPTADPPLSEKKPTQKKHRSPSDGGSSYGFFVDEEEDEEVDTNSENIPPSKIADALTSKLCDKELALPPRELRGFGQELSITLPSDQDPFTDPSTSIGIPIDPMLLSEGYEDILGYKESSPKKTIIPLKLPPEDDDSSDNQENEDPSLSSRTALSAKDVSSPASQETGTESRHNDRPNKRRQSSGMMKHTPGVLAGAVVFVDVHTSEGADAGRTFEELLRHLGARVIKQWSWNPSSPSQDDRGTKVGITHVVFKEGSPRTLQKVKQTKGLVVCVGLGWVLSCVDRHEWVEENEFLVDLEIVPRGGHRRRKSMEPKLVAAMMNSDETQNYAPKTPLPMQKSFMPQLLATEPPKKDQAPSFLREKLMMARRKSMQFAPKVGSPLARNWSVDE